MVAKHVLDPIDLSKGAANFQTAAVARFPLVGQIMEPGRAFHPPATSVAVQAIYDTESIAILVRWNDMMADKTRQRRTVHGRAARGRGARLPTPAGGAAAAPVADDPFADPAAAPTTVAPSEFNDAVAIQIPSQVPVGARKPYFIFGDGQNSVDLWFFDLGNEPSRFSTPAAAAPTSRSTTRAMSPVSRSYDQGEWSVVFKRPLRPPAARVHARRIPAHRLLGVGRVLARARQPAGAVGVVLALRRTAKMCRPPSAR